MPKIDLKSNVAVAFRPVLEIITHFDKTLYDFDKTK